RNLNWPTSPSLNVLNWKAFSANDKTTSPSSMATFSSGAFGSAFQPSFSCLNVVRIWMPNAEADQRRLQLSTQTQAAGWSSQWLGRSEVLAAVSFYFLRLCRIRIQRKETQKPDNKQGDPASCRN